MNEMQYAVMQPWEVMQAFLLAALIKKAQHMDILNYH
jgi:hypothetical protein